MGIITHDKRGGFKGEITLINEGRTISALKTCAGMRIFARPPPVVGKSGVPLVAWHTVKRSNTPASEKLRQAKSGIIKH